MQFDSRELADGAVLECDVCIVGAGPAGMSVALGLLAARARVVVLESGSDGPSPDIQALNEGVVVGGPYLGLRATRHRGVGGTVNLWNTDLCGITSAKFAPLDDWDLEPAGTAELPGWPLDYSVLRRYYDAAQDICGLGPFRYDGAGWASAGRSPWPLGEQGLLTTRIYQLGPAAQFLDVHRRTLRGAPDVRLQDHATCTGLVLGAGGRVTAAQVRVTSTGARVSVRSRVFVLASGAVENARILLLSAAAAGGELGTGSAWIGHGFMEHPRDSALTLKPRDGDVFARAGFYDFHEAAAGVRVCGRLALTREAARAGGLPNMSVTVLPRSRPSGAWRSMMRRLGIARRPPVGYGWWTATADAGAYDGFRLLMNLEQRPRRQNRVVLASARDPMGLPLAALHWRWSPEEQSELEQLRVRVAAALESAALGRVECDTSAVPDPNAHHHAGTTRMAETARWGVVDADCRVHGLENLYVAGASIFPTAGFANPTLTIVALATRLAECLRRRI